MSASGKSSNRLSEYNRGYSGGGHGIYAEQGRGDRAAMAARFEQQRRQPSADCREDQHGACAGGNRYGYPCTCECHEANK